MRRSLFLVGLGILLAVSRINAQEPLQWIIDYNEALSNGDYKKSEEILEKNFDRNNSDCCYINARRNIRDNNYDWAIGWLDEALKKHVQTSYYWKSTIYIDLASVYNTLARYDDALECFIKAKEDNIDNRRGHLIDDLMRIAEQYTTMEQYAKAEDSFYYILRIDENNEDAKINLAYLYLNYASKEDSVMLDSIAYSLINEVILWKPSSAKAYYARAQYNQKRRENYKNAINDYLAFLYYDKDNTNATDDLYYCATFEFQYAITAINQWVNYCNTKGKREKDKYFFIRKRAKIYENNAYYREAIDDYSEVIEDELEVANKLWAFSSRGDSYLNIYEYQKAINDYTTYIENSEDFNDWIYIQRAIAFTELGKYNEAMNDYTIVIRNSGKIEYISYAYYRRGWIKEFLKDDYGALRDYNKGIEANPTYAYLYLMRGETYQRLNDIENARLDYNRVLELDTIPYGESCRQYALFFLGDSIGAVNWMEQIIDLQPYNSGLYYDKACLYARMGNVYESVEALAKALELGYRRIAHVKIDNDLDPIRNLPEFKSLIEKYEKDTNSQRIEELLKQERSKISDKDKLDLLHEFKL